MPQHIRYADSSKNERVVVKFVREDLLWRGWVAGVFMPINDGRRVVGPTILDMLVRREIDGKPLWSLQTEHELVDGSTKRRGKALHPLKENLVSSGRPVAVDGDFVRIQKTSSVCIGAYVFRLAVGTLGTIHDAHTSIASKAIAAWSADLARSLALYKAIKAAPKEQLMEDTKIAELRPAGSISDQVETDILRDVCDRLGVDPDLNIKRVPGRPRKSGAALITYADGK